MYLYILYIRDVLYTIYLQHAITASPTTQISETCIRQIDLSSSPWLWHGSSTTSKQREKKEAEKDRRSIDSLKKFRRALMKTFWRAAVIAFLLAVPRRRGKRRRRGGAQKRTRSESSCDEPLKFLSLPSAALRKRSCKKVSLLKSFPGFPHVSARRLYLASTRLYNTS